jgi:hypothetical protein
MEKVMVCLFSPSPTFTDISTSGGGGESYLTKLPRKAKLLWRGNFFASRNK